MTYGASPYGTGPYGQPFSPDTPQGKDSIPSSRYITGNGEFRRAEDGTGTFEGMNDTMQRALILMALNVPRVDKITADFASAQDAAIRRALVPLTDTEKVLEIVEIEVIDNGTAQTATRVVLRDLIDGQVRVLNR